MGAATQTAAKANPSQKFAIVDFSYPKPLKNVGRPGVQHGARTASWAATWPRA